MNTKEKKGLNLFINKSCIGCHNAVALGGQALRKFPLVHHQIWSMSNVNSINKLKKKYDKSSYDYLVNQLGKEKVMLLKEGYFHNSKENKVYTTMTSISHLILLQK